MLWVHPAWHTTGSSEMPSEYLNEYENGQTEAAHNDALRGKCPGKSALLYPRYDEEGTDKRAHVQMYRVESDDGHRLQWITVDNIGGCYGVSHLNASANC